MTATGVPNPWLERDNERHTPHMVSLMGFPNNDSIQHANRIRAIVDSTVLAASGVAEGRSQRVLTPVFFSFFFLS